MKISTHANMKNQEIFDVNSKQSNTIELFNIVTSQ